MTSATRTAYQLVTARDAGRCVRCGANWRIQRDHRKNRSQGGPTACSNLQLLCSACHQWKTEHPTRATRTGYAVPGYVLNIDRWPGCRLDFDPVTMRLVHVYALYDDAGRITRITADQAVSLVNGLIELF